jgi:hypothetical protein
MGIRIYLAYDYKLHKPIEDYISEMETLTDKPIQIVEKPVFE